MDSDFLIPQYIEKTIGIQNDQNPDLSVSFKQKLNLIQSLPSLNKC